MDYNHVLPGHTPNIDSYNINKCFVQVSLIFKSTDRIVSGEIPEEPVVSTKSGHVFERRLIEKYLSDDSKCPVTGETLTVEDLKQIVLLKPRTSNANSIPALLLTFQNEWDALMLETFQLKEQCNQLKMELATALYETDASKRVIARLLKERDDARSQLEQIQIGIGQDMHVVNASEKTERAPRSPGRSSPKPSIKSPVRSPAKSPKRGALKQEASMDVDEPIGLAQDVIASIDAKAQELSQGRKKRKIRETLATQEEIGNFAPSKTHSSSKSGVVCMEVSSTSMIVAGNKKGHLAVFESSTGETLFEIDAHKKEVSSVKWAGQGFVSASKDGTVKEWTKNDDGWHETASIKVSSDSVTLSVHPLGEYCLVASEDKHWNFVDLKQQTVLVNTEAPASITACHVHPDGGLFGVGTSTGSILVYDLKQQSIAATFDGHKGKINSLEFSENGYYLAAASADEELLRIWDLRKLNNVHSIELDSPCLQVSWDLSGQYLGALKQNNTCQVFLNKQWTELKAFEVKSALCFAFAPDAKYLAVGSSNGKIQIIE